jgi:hypothetical protein
MCHGLVIEIDKLIDGEVVKQAGMLSDILVQSSLLFICSVHADVNPKSELLSKTNPLLKSKVSKLLL